MSQINKDPNAFQLDDLILSNIGSITIKDVSEGRSQGRRFKLVFAGKESDELVFHDIFKQVQKLARKEKNLENLTAIADFLNTIKDAEKIAADKYTVEAGKDFGYRFNTGLHRLFDIGSWGSHSNRIDALKDKITKRNTDLQTTFDNLDAISDIDEKNDAAEELVDKYGGSTIVVANGEIFTGPDASRRARDKFPEMSPFILSLPRPEFFTGHFLL